MKNIFCLILLVSIFGQIEAQPMICGTPASMTPTCLEACLICDIDGFTGMNGNPGTGQLPPGFCTTVKHNAQWIAFMAGSEDLVMELYVFDCKDGNGLEVGIYESPDCVNYSLISNCNGDALENSTTVLTMKKKLVIGQYYYFVMDGNRGDVCKYRIKVTKGSTKIWPIDSSGVIRGPGQVCEGKPASFKADTVIAAIFYRWTIDGSQVSTKQEYTMQNPTKDFTICVQAANVCDDAPPVCRLIKVLPSKRTSTQQVICKEDCFMFKDTLICDTGTYSRTLLDQNGCDSIVTLSLSNYPTGYSRDTFHICNGRQIKIGNETYTKEGFYQQIQKTIHGCDSLVEIQIVISQNSSQDFSFQFCEGDSIQLGASTYTKAGIYQQQLTTQYGCDSIINLTLSTIQCNITTNAVTRSVKCYGDSTGQITFFVSQGTPSFTYQIQQIGQPTVLITGTISGLNIPTSINNLKAGSYILTVRDVFGNQRISTFVIDEPTPLRVFGNIDQFGIYQIRCNGEANGKIDLTTSGGTPRYNYSWDNGSISEDLNKLKAGTYSVIITDASSCSEILQFELKEPPPILSDLMVVNPICEVSNSGRISVLTPSGGIPPYLYSVNNKPYNSTVLLDSLTAGFYTIQVKDSLGCIWAKTVELKDPEHNFLGGKNFYEIELGDSIYLDVNYYGTIESVVWTPADYLSCDTCINPVSKPLKDIQYKLISSSKDHCPDSFTVYIKVNIERAVWAPNVFSPNADGLNDRFILFGNKQLQSIPLLEIYTRWGELIYKGENLKPNTSTNGWDGSFKGKAMNPSVFVWKAEVKYYDGYKEHHSGEVTLLR
ncbi:MAG TPA: gliding motility-associated C-terminal domain-containing protein [Saprospiraceae bacterium]|nr:gliding motility-associated C-terminal domain-containing protein [Saprospiraceae bacterium]